jgi:DeoR family fructose operon transcriptional repressor
MECAKKTIVVADHTKVGTISFVQMGSVDSIDLLITDSGAKPEAVDALQKAGVDVMIV